MAHVVIGNISSAVASAVNHPEYSGKPVILGDDNITHMKNFHPEDYRKYGNRINEIISTPDYVGINKKDESIEFVKEYYINGNYVKLAVRASAKGTFFARSLYTLNRNRVEDFVKKGTLIQLN